MLTILNLQTFAEIIQLLDQISPKELMMFSKTPQCAVTTRDTATNLLLSQSPTHTDHTSMSKVAMDMEMEEDMETLDMEAALEEVAHHHMEVVGEVSVEAMEAAHHHMEVVGEASVEAMEANHHHMEVVGEASVEAAHHKVNGEVTITKVMAIIKVKINLAEIMEPIETYY